MSITDLYLPDIDRVKTKKAVEAAIGKYRMYLLTLSLDRMPKITQSCLFVPAITIKSSHSSTESAAIANVDYENERIDNINRMVNAVNRLSSLERTIMISRYLEKEDVYDYQLYNKLLISERKYYRIKARAFLKLALALGIEQYK
ncbi:ArpU family phage packaging/lysis transcriptional regulator [Jeotgalibacillus soli]|uniref:ArpU family transcriptional regulator n=1 Tax=Jeotgalibacillus soli TaxID=889306 RepID=A0A0C2VF45_9BACL|nr:ArpU family phage packaging/lysis transcriptional regulator [Jeotgalibacillus soli]KIL42628.1 ArpU family transcriptional regulator [Jeotgalibacillus soli]